MTAISTSCPSIWPAPRWADRCTTCPGAPLNPIALPPPPQPAVLAAALRDLTAPRLCDAQGALTPRFCALSVLQQVNVLLALRAEPSKFPADATAEAVAAAASPAAPRLVRTLAGGDRPPPCPQFLFSAEPAFPWAPQLCSPGEAVARRAAAAAAQRATQAQPAASVPESGLAAAQERLKFELEELARRDEGASLSPAAAEALATVLGAGPDALRACGLETLPSDTMLLVVRAAAGPGAAFAACAALARGALLPAAAALDAPPPQALTAAAQHLAEANPQALVDHCWRPLLAAGALGAPQAEFLLRTIRRGEVPGPLLHGVLDALGEVEWTEGDAAVVQAVIDAKPLLPPASVAAACAGFLAAAQGPLAGSIKLAKALMAFVKGYGEEMGAGEVGRCRAAAAAAGTFMAKPTLAFLDKLQPNGG